MAAPTITIEDDVSIFMGVREATAQHMVLPVRDDKEANARFTERQTGYVIGKVYLHCAHTLRFQNFCHIGKGRDTQS